jgi:hypothetical protein
MTGGGPDGLRSAGAASLYPTVSGTSAAMTYFPDLSDYVDEVAFRWSNRVRKKVASKKGKTRKNTLLVPVEKQMTDLVRAGIGRRISRTKNYSFRAFSSAIVLVA